MRLADVAAWLGRFLFLWLLLRLAWDELSGAWEAYAAARGARERADDPA